MGAVVIIHNILPCSKLLTCLQIPQGYGIRFQNGIVLQVILRLDLRGLYIGVGCIRHQVGSEVCIITVDGWRRDELLLVRSQRCHVFRIRGLYVVFEASKIIMLLQFQVTLRRCEDIENCLLVFCGTRGAQMMCLNIRVRTDIWIVGVDVDWCQLRDVLKALSIRLEILLRILDFRLEATSWLLVLSCQGVLDAIQVKLWNFWWHLGSRADLLWLVSSFFEVLLLFLLNFLLFSIKCDLFQACKLLFLGKTFR